MPIRNPRWLPPQVIVLTQDHMGKYRNIFFFEAIALIEPNLCINHWKVLYKFTHGLGLYILRFYPSLSLGVKLEYKGPAHV
jgi:hypothetical protein